MGGLLRTMDQRYINFFARSGSFESTVLQILAPILRSNTPEPANQALQDYQTITGRYGGLEAGAKVCRFEEPCYRSCFTVSNINCSNISDLNDKRKLLYVTRKHDCWKILFVFIICHVHIASVHFSKRTSISTFPQISTSLIPHTHTPYT